MTDGKIFISYRRVDTSGYAGRLYDRLRARFGEDNIFMDVEGLDPGVDFVETIEKSVSSCDVLVALIGRQWLTVQDAKGGRRLDNPEDFVRLEIAAALERGVRVMPILVQGASMPGSRQLPQTLKRLARLNALEIRHERFNADADRLARAIEAYLEEETQRREQEAAEQAARQQAEREQKARQIAQQKAQIADCLEKARAALDADDWKTAQRNYRQILRIRPDHSEAQSGLLTASQNLELTRLYGQAILYQDEGQYERALRNLRHIQSKDADYRNVPALIETIEARLAERKKDVGSKPGPGSTQRAVGFFRGLPRWVTLGGGGLSLVIMLALVCWGGNALIASLIETVTPQPTKNTVATQAATHTSRPTFQDTQTISPTETAFAEPSTTPSITAPIPSSTPPDVKYPGMVFIPAGEFSMGSDSGDSDEVPVHTVYLDAYWIDETEVTNEMFASFLSEVGNQEEGGVTWLDAKGQDVLIENIGEVWQPKSGFTDHPVIEVSWYGARAYCEWVGGRLPTEAEWEKAARGGLEGELYPWGDEDPVCTPGAENGAQYVSCDGSTVPVKTFSPNGYGLYDMAGNVWEWVADWYDGDYYVNSPESNPTGPEEGSARVLRGGSWSDYAYDLRAADRNYLAPSNTGYGLGFRCARSP